jgi:hypothetical protein
VAARVSDVKAVAVRTPVRYNVIENMRTLNTQVRVRRLVRAFSEALNRLLSDPAERQMAGLVAAKLLELAGDAKDAWSRESLAGRPAEALDSYVRDSLRTAEFAIAGISQAGADLELLGRDFDGATLPLEVFLRGLDAEPALERSA